MSLDLNEKTNKNNYYVKNKDLLVEIEKLQQTNQFSDTLGKYIIQIVNGLSHRPNFNGYTYIEDMKSEAHVAIIKGEGPVVSQDDLEICEEE